MTKEARRPSVFTTSLARRRWSDPFTSLERRLESLLGERILEPVADEELGRFAKTGLKRSEP
jgi:hypothetical protein